MSKAMTRTLVACAVLVALMVGLFAMGVRFHEGKWEVTRLGWRQGADAERRAQREAQEAPRDGNGRCDPGEVVECAPVVTLDHGDEQKAYAEADSVWGNHDGVTTRDEFCKAAVAYGASWKAYCP